MITLGIDIGSRNTKAVLFDSQCGSILYSGFVSTDVYPLKSVDALIETAYEKTGVDIADKTACTGYGRKLYHQDARIISEISCHAAGILYLYPETRTVIDIGGQDSKVITLDNNGKVRDFVMNDKCAAGTGRFLEMTAIRLGCSLDELSSLAKQAVMEMDISSTCVVFAESEIIGMISKNEQPANIARAVNRSIAKRITTQIGTLDFSPPVVFTGGVAKNSDLAQCLSGYLDCLIRVPPDPVITAALGAAILVAQ
ncbi:MAG: acyl-CoA dehydratase activase [Candidatus Syntrophosphaera sp.]